VLYLTRNESESALPMTMPSFLMIGAAKSGTSAIYAYLEQHPDIFTCDVKETGFFAFEGSSPNFRGPGDRIMNRWFVTDLEKYRSLFRGSQSHRAVGESSDLYLYYPEAASRIRRYIPDAKLIAVLRNPVDRAYSGYRFLVRDGREPLPTFEAAVEAETWRIAADWLPIWHHTMRGYYYRQLKHYFDVFDRSQLQIHLYDDFVADPLGVMQEIFRFVGVDVSFVPDMSVRHNVSGTPRSRLLHAVLARPNAAKDFAKTFVPQRVRGHLRRTRAILMERNTMPGEPKLASQTRRALAARFQEDIRQLSQLLGRDLSRWLDE
jgi:hypothetical protein